MSGDYPVGISVSFLNNWYSGRTPSGTVEVLPSFARVFSALVGAGGSGSASVLGSDGERTLSPEVRSALEWIESNPPQMLSVPKHGPVCSDPEHYRKTGNMAKKGNGRVRPQVKFCYGTPVFGDLSWGWSSVPQYVQDTVGKLCLEVSYLGDVLSKAELRWGPLPSATHRLGDGWSVGDQQDVPQSGRLEELVSHHALLRLQTRSQKTSESKEFIGGQSPTTDSDKLRRDPRTRIRLMTYVADTVEAEPLSAPWTHGVWIPLHKAISPDHVVFRTRFLHRQLNKQADRSARSSDSVYPVPPVLNGHHEDLAVRPANNVAVVYIPEPEVAGSGHAGGGQPGFLILVPEGVPSEDLALILQSACALRHIEDAAGSPAIVDPTRWWDVPESGHMRLWTTYPLAVAETKISRKTLRLAKESAQASLRYVFRNRTGNTGTVVHARQSRTTDMHRFYHKATPMKPGGLPLVATYDAVVDLNGVLPDTAVCAIGQSRHFGVGLLLPLDIPISHFTEEAV